MKAKGSLVQDNKHAQLYLYSFIANTDFGLNTVVIVFAENKAEAIKIAKADERFKRDRKLADGKLCMVVPGPLKGESIKKCLFYPDYYR